MTRPPYGDGYGTHLPKAVVLAEAQNWRCAYCPTILTYVWGHRSRQIPTAATVDHVTALHGGGQRVWDNEIAACSACNCAKGEYSAMLFWLLMQRHHGDRRFAHRRMRNSTKKRRGKMIKQLMNELCIDNTVTNAIAQ